MVAEILMHNYGDDPLPHRTLFYGGTLGSELALVKSIFSTLGTPTAETWPVSLPRPSLSYTSLTALLSSPRKRLASQTGAKCPSTPFPLSSGRPSCLRRLPH